MEPTCEHARFAVPPNEKNQASRVDMQDAFRSKPGVLQPADASSLQETFFAQVARWVDWERREEPSEFYSKGRIPNRSPI